MRKINAEMINAIRNGRNWMNGNTRVETSYGGRIDVYLHGNRIFSQQGNVKIFTLAGWNTTTTRSRLGALGMDVKQRNFIPIYNGKEIESNKWYEVK